MVVQVTEASGIATAGELRQRRALLPAQRGCSACPASAGLGAGIQLVIERGQGGIGADQRLEPS